MLLTVWQHVNRCQAELKLHIVQYNLSSGSRLRTGQISPSLCLFV